MSALVQPVIGDTPSEEVELLRRQHNVMVKYVTDLEAAVAAAADFAAFKTAVGLLDVTGFRTIALTRTVPLKGLFPTHG